jgi:hypothetical protein
MVDEFEEKNRLAAAYIYSATSSARKDTPIDAACGGNAS